MGPNVHAGETLQLLVGSNVWKKSRLLPEDITAASKPFYHPLISTVKDSIADMIYRG